MKKLIALVLIAMLGAIGAASAATPDGCEITNGGTGTGCVPN